MRIDIHHHISIESAQLDRIENAVGQLLQRSSNEMSALDNLKAAVQKNNDATQSAVTLIQGLKQKLDDAIASGDPAQLQALSDELGRQDQALADAVTANTPADTSGGASTGTSDAGSTGDTTGQPTT